MNPLQRASLFRVIVHLPLPLAAATAHAGTAAAAERWSAHRTWEWYNSQPLLVGFNYIPATAINTTGVLAGGHV